MSTNNNSNYVRKIVQAALLISLALVVRNFGYMVYFAGAPGMRISFAGIFLNFAAIILGPLYGGIAHGLLDILDFLIKPTGAYIPWITVNAVLSGIMTGLLWKVVKDVDTPRLQKVFFVFFIFVGMIGLVNYICMRFIPGSIWAKVIGSIGKKKGSVSVGLMATSSVGLLLLGLNFIIKRFNKNPGIYGNYLKVLVVTLVPGVIVTTLNTYTLMLFIPNLGKLGFMVFWIPRITEEIFMEVVQAYVISFMLIIYKKYLAA